MNDDIKTNDAVEQADTKAPPVERLVITDYGTGFNAERWPDNPLEERFAKKWEEINRQGSVLKYLTSPTNDKRLSTMTDDDIKVAGNVIQWLGSHVGQCFLKDVLDIDFEL